jgi:hypothetical protein
MENKHITGYILTSNNFLEDFNISNILEGIAIRLRQRRLGLI